MKTPARKKQRGLAALTMSLLLLLAMTMVALFAHRSMLFELRSGANQVRAASAFELAEAGLEWGLARLDDPHHMAAAPSCVAEAPSRQRLRERALPWSAVCTQGAAGIAAQCSCGTDETALASEASGFLLQASATDANTVQLVSRGCTRLSACRVGTPMTMEARASTRMLARSLPLLRLEPAATLMSASSVTLGNGVAVTNAEAASRGITVIAGQNVALGETSVLAGWPGTPPSATLRENEATLAAWALDDAALFFKAFFGVEAQDYRQDPMTRVVAASECSSASQCASLVVREAAAGYSQFWVESDVAFDASMLGAGGMLGSPQRPLVLVLRGEVKLGAGVVAHALWFGVGPKLKLHGGGAQIHGALVAHGPLELDGEGLEATFAPTAPQGRFVKVPGSWRDFANAGTP